MSKQLKSKINEECKKAVALRKLSYECGFEKGQALREQQQVHYDKFLFFKNLQNAMNKKANNQEKDHH